MKRIPGTLLLAVTGALLLLSCEGGADLLAPYEAHRPLILQKVTQSYQPEVKWVGGRVAAVGVNRGTTPALDSTLVWMRVAAGNEIESHVKIGRETAADLVLQHGGTPLDSLRDGEEYTFWLAEREALDAALASSARNPFTFADTTMTMELVLRGLVRGGENVTIQVTKEETLLSTRYVVDWSPATPFRQVAIRKGSASPAFRDLVWHVVQSDDSAPDALRPPLIIGEVPEGASEAIAWPEDGFESDTYTLWMTTSAWRGDFGLRPRGMAYFVMFATNF